MPDIIGTVCLLIIFTCAMVVGAFVVYVNLGIVGVITAAVLLAMTALLHFKDKI